MPTYQGHRAVSRYDGSTSDAWVGYQCAHCGQSVSGAVVAAHIDPHARHVRWTQCPNCGEPSAIDSSGAIHPGARYGPVLEGLPEEVARAYDEARACMSVGAFGAAELVCRRILMHVAVDRGASAGESFAAYVDHLADEGYVTPPMRSWVDLIRQHGNQATHDITPVDRRRAEGTVQFTAQLLRSVYEMAHLAASFSEPVGADTVDSAST